MGPKFKRRMMRIAKEFRWEMGHRLSFHNGKCINLHGHSYKLLVEFEGDIDSNGMMMDYFDVKKIISPIVEKIDHAFMVYEKDTPLIESLTKLNSNFVPVPYQPTAENICRYFLDNIKSAGLPKNITALKVKIFETESTYAEEEIKL
jgi:6-pyruvoyltetrahydropterin/6-carboxytetrahydropterin synthase